MSAVQRWRKKFAFAVDGLVHSIRTQNSFWVHLPVAVAMLAISVWLRFELWQWSVVAIVITLVLAAECLNTAIEQLVSVLHPEHDERIGHALDAAAAAVLVTALGAAVVGMMVLAASL
jgi:diacylglycerol kinase